MRLSDGPFPKEEEVTEEGSVPGDLMMKAAASIASTGDGEEISPSRRWLAHAV